MPYKLKYSGFGLQLASGGDGEDFIVLGHVGSWDRLGQNQTQNPNSELSG